MLYSRTCNLQCLKSKSVDVADGAAFPITFSSPTSHWSTPYVRDMQIQFHSSWHFCDEMESVCYPFFRFCCAESKQSTHLLQAAPVYGEQKQKCNLNGFCLVLKIVFRPSSHLVVLYCTIKRGYVFRPVMWLSSDQLCR